MPYLSNCGCQNCSSIGLYYFVFVSCSACFVCVLLICVVKAPRPVEKETRRKDRSRSKSPFRSFRWKKSPKYSGASDDEATHHSGICFTCAIESA